MLLFFFEAGRDVIWKDGVLEGLVFLLALSSSVCLNSDVHHSEMAYFNPRMMAPASFLPASGTRMSLAVNHMNYRSDLLSSRVSVACCAQNQPLRIPQNRCFKH